MNLVLTDETPYEIFSRMMDWPKSDELDSMIDQFDRPLKLDMDAEINALMAEVARRAFLIGFRCGQDPTKLIFTAGD